MEMSPRLDGHTRPKRCVPVREISSWAWNLASSSASYAALTRPPPKNELDIPFSIHLSKKSYTAWLSSSQNCTVKVPGEESRPAKRLLRDLWLISNISTDFSGMVTFSA